MQDVRKKIKALFVWMAEVKEELSKPQTPSLADLLIAYYNQRNAGAWSNKARTGNLKQFAEAVNYLTENKLLTLEDLQERLSSVRSVKRLHEKEICPDKGIAGIDTGGRELPAAKTCSYGIEQYQV